MTKPSITTPPTTKPPRAKAPGTGRQAKETPASAGRPEDFEAALAPFRLDPPPADLAPAIVYATQLGFSIAADLLDLHDTCPRKACRQSCTAGGDRLCEAQFPAMALHMVTGMQFFLLSIPQETALALHARRGGADQFSGDMGGAWV